MNIHEYQAKELFRASGIPVPKGYLAHSAIEAEFAMRRLGVDVAVVKAQIHAGGRGKGGGVKVVKSPEECAAVAEKMLGMTLVTHQTGPAGKLVRKVYVEAGSAIDKEYYLAALLDRETATVTFMFSTEGGMDIEEVAEKTPEKIIKVAVDPTTGLRSHHIKALTAAFVGSPVAKASFGKMVANLYKMFLAYDFSLLEINPLVITKSDEIFALDGKMNFDDNALFRHPEIAAMRDFAEEDMREIDASKFGLSYIGLEGNIGCLVNGAGLAMATMDIIKFYGGVPANFLDVGGGASQEQVKQAFKIILTDKHVKGVFVNIFGGIMKCDTIANGIIAAARELGLQVPLVVRLEGTNVEQGRALLNESGLRIVTCDDMADGAKKIVEAVRG
jgi:succinyl-CoA synthetase beta subunit